MARDAQLCAPRAFSNDLARVFSYALCMAEKSSASVLRLYNTLTKREEDFVSQVKGKVSMYTCGPTVYSRPHIGNYSSFLMADLLRRWLEVEGAAVTHVKNITDVGHLLHDADEGDDKVEKEAAKEKIHPLEIARRYTEQYLEDEKALNFLEPTHRPRATEYVPQMKQIIDTLLEKGNAYVTADGIYFDVSTFPQYGGLSGNTLDNLSAGARVDVNEQKRHAADFALWKFCVGPNEHHVLRWPSPGKSTLEGFPGWHIECSAMSSALLGETIDIHTGGEDNIFPHHECEIAQSESATGKKPFVRMWLHRRRIDLEGEKMSKSLGNVLSIPDIVAKGYSPLDIRYYLLSVHYRTNLKFSWKGMDDAKKARKRVTEWMAEVESWKESDETEESEESEEWSQKFAEAMNSDLNTPAALAVIFDAMAWSRNQKGFSKSGLAALKKFIADARHTFGCFESEEKEGIPADVQKLLDSRDEARKAKDFAESDHLRSEIEKHGYTVKDTIDGQKLIKS
jgi:cysteinyl-tRNA synthetase